MSIIEEGQYGTGDGAMVHIAEAVAACRVATQCSRPQLDELCAATLQSTPLASTSLEIQNETTLAGRFQALALKRLDPIGVLICVGKNPAAVFSTAAMRRKRAWPVVLPSTPRS